MGAVLDWIVIGNHRACEQHWHSHRLPRERARLAVKLNQSATVAIRWLCISGVIQGCVIGATKSHAVYKNTTLGEMRQKLMLPQQDMLTRDRPKEGARRILVMFTKQFGSSFHCG